MLTFFFGTMTMIPPPIAMAAFAAATISRAGPWETGWASMRLGWVAYIAPFAFIAAPALLLDGSPAEIAEALIIAEGTAKNHVSNILGKLDARDRAQAVARGQELGLL